LGEGGDVVVDISEKVGLAITALGAVPGFVEAFFPGEISKMTRQSRKAVLSACAVITLVGLAVVFLWPENSPPASGDITISGDNAGNACTTGAKCTQNNYGPPRNSEGLYQEGQQIGVADTPGKKIGNVETFEHVTYDGVIIGGAPIEYRDMKLSCKTMYTLRNGTRLHVLGDQQDNLKCEIIGVVNH
jgi:hypothetical protein